MNTSYDRRSDTLSIVLAPGEVAAIEEDKPGAILDASKTIPDLTSINPRIAM